MQELRSRMLGQQHNRKQGLRSRMLVRQHIHKLVLRSRKRAQRRSKRCRSTMKCRNVP